MELPVPLQVRRALLLAALLVSCSDAPRESWVRLEDDLLEGVRFGPIWEAGKDTWMIVGPPEDLLTFSVLHFDGDRWAYVAEGQWPGEQRRGLLAFVPDDLWVVAGTGEEFHLWQGDGSSWTLVGDAFTGLGAPGTNVTAVWGTATDDLWVAAELEDGDDVALRYDGETWHVMFRMAVIPDYDGRLRRGCSLDRHDVVLWGRSTTLPQSGFMHAMFRWDGEAWNEVPYGNVSLLCQGGGAWGIGSDDDGPGPEDLFHSDGAGGWEPLMLFDEPSSMRDVWIDDHGDGWILGFEGAESLGYGTARAEIWRLSDGVVTPTLANGPALYDGDLENVRATASDRVFAFGWADLVLEYVGPE
jgi:hypothetical protein